MGEAPRIRPELQPRALLAAYASGAFPMPDPDTPGDLLWFSPDPRGLLPLDERLHVPRRLRQKLRQGRFVCTSNRAFRQVMLGCADRPEGSWITDDFLAAYGRLHELRLAHSVEAWVAGGDFRPGQLAGGVYGVALGGAFFAESMFHRVTDAGKAALAHLLAHLRSRGFLLCDIQWKTRHLATFGAFEIPRHEYLLLLATAVGTKTTFADPTTLLPSPVGGGRS